MWQTWLLLCLTVGSPTGDLIPEGNATDTEIVALYPNTVLEGNEGEFIVVHVPTRQSTANWTFRDDGRQSAKPPPVSVEGTVAFSRHPDAAADYLDIPVYELEGWFQLAVGGEAVTLKVDGRAVDTVAYDGPAPRAHLWIRGADDPWVPLAATDFEPVADSGGVEAFVLPDSPAAITEAIDGATDRILLGGYELGEGPVLEALLAAVDRGVDVAVHAEGRPVGGISVHYGAALDALDDAGVSVTVHHGPYTRYGYHHPKYTVIDDRLLVTTENFKPAGTGGAASRGWGLIVDAPAVVDAAVAVFEADTGWRDAVPWGELRDDIRRTDDEPDDGTYPVHHPPLTAESVSMQLVVTPDNAEEVLLETIDAATSSIHIKQVRIADADFPLLAAAIDRARSGVEVRVLLSDRWYVRNENQALATELRNIAEDEGLDLEVALVDDTAAFDRIHAKGLIVDGHTAVVGSINWNNHSLRENRELAVVIESEGVAGFYHDVFEADWPVQGATSWEVPITLVVAALAAGGLVLEHARRLRMEESGNDPSPERVDG